MNHYEQKNQKSIVALPIVTVSFIIFVAMTAKAASWDTSFTSTFPGVAWAGVTAVSADPLQPRVWVAEAVSDAWTTSYIHDWHNLKGWDFKEPVNNWVNGTVTALASDGTKVYVGGHFDNAGGLSVNNIAVYNSQSDSWSTLGSGLDGEYVNVLAIALGRSSSPGKRYVYVGGSFTNAGGLESTNVARWTGTEWQSMAGGVAWTYMGHIFGAVQSIVTITNAGYDDVYVVGGFERQTATGVVTNIAKWSESLGSWSGFGNGLVGACGENSIATGLALGTGASTIYAVGEFTKVDNYVLICDPTRECGPCNLRYATLNPNTGALAAWAPQFIGGFWPVAVTALGNNQYVGGSGEMYLGFPSLSSDTAFQCVNGTWMNLPAGGLLGVEDISSNAQGVFMVGWPTSSSDFGVRRLVP